MIKPRIPWKKIWKELFNYWKRYHARWPKMRKRIAAIITQHIVPWTVDWAAVWEVADKCWAIHGRRFESWENYQQPLIQRLVRKHLKEPKK